MGCTMEQKREGSEAQGEDRTNRPWPCRPVHALAQSAPRAAWSCPEGYGRPTANKWHPHDHRDKGNTSKSNGDQNKKFAKPVFAKTLGVR